MFQFYLFHKSCYFVHRSYGRFFFIFLFLFSYPEALAKFDFLPQATLYRTRLFVFLRKIMWLFILTSLIWENHLSMIMKILERLEIFDYLKSFPVLVWRVLKLLCDSFWVYHWLMTSQSRVNLQNPFSSIWRGTPGLGNS